MRIALVSYDFPEYCIRQANAMSRDGEVLLMLPATSVSDFAALVDREVDVHAFNQPRLRQPLRQYRSIQSLIRAIDRFGPDVVHFQNGHLWFNFALPRIRRRPLVMTIHNAEHHPGDQLSRKTPQGVLDFGYRRADRIIVHGEVLRSAVTKRLGFPESKIHVIPHVAIGALEETADCSSTDDGMTVLFFGRIWPYKGLEYLVRAEPLVTKQIPGARFVIAGEGEDFERYRRLIVHPERFEVHNEFVTQQKRDELFRQSSVVVLPYVEASQSGVVPVAYSFGKPVVATRTGGLPEAVDHETTGLLVPPRDEEALADAIVQLLRHKSTRLAMGRAGKSKLHRECSPEVVASQTIDVYRRAIRDRLGKVSRSNLRVTSPPEVTAG